MRCSSASRSCAARASCVRSPASSIRAALAIALASWRRARPKASSNLLPMSSARIRASRTTTSASISSICGSRWPSRQTRRSASTRRSTCWVGWATSNRFAPCLRCASSRSVSTSTWSEGAIPPPRRCAPLPSSSRRAARRQSARSVPSARCRSTCRLCPNRSPCSASSRASRRPSCLRLRRR